MHRIAFADANFLTACYYDGENHAKAAEWDTDGQSKLVLSVPALAECQCAFWRLGGQWPLLESHVVAGRFAVSPRTFPELNEMASGFYRRYAPRSNVGTLDLMHLAAAADFGCQWFLSFDTNSHLRIIAAVEGFKVFPELSNEERAGMARFRH